MIATIFDYGAGNLHSLAKAVAQPGITVRIEPDPLRAIDTDLLVLPGVGAFSFAAERLSPARVAMRQAILAGLPTVGVCLGMQLLFTSSEEGPGDGLAVFEGTVTRLAATRLPHIGWNSLSFETGVDTPAVYYANSFACRPADESIVLAWTTYENDRFPAIIRRGSTCGLQFHPEKSSTAGVATLRDLIAEVTS
jgi:imidazole glycerol-phosphate synthase subunit HisH